MFKYSTDTKYFCVCEKQQSPANSKHQDQCYAKYASYFANCFWSHLYSICISHFLSLLTSCHVDDDETMLFISQNIFCWLFPGGLTCSFILCMSYMLTVIFIELMRFTKSFKFQVAFTVGAKSFCQRQNHYVPVTGPLPPVVIIIDNVFFCASSHYR